MPIYEYRCNSCQNDFERLLFKLEEKVECPGCGTGDVKRRLSSFSFTGGNPEPDFEGGCGRCGADTPGRCRMQN
ncbi:MAG TPA: FmdB family zinc ribbon protein [Candidatus Xenobia bacterium]|jgi:putative FmdB family regulatory protein